MYSSFCVDLLLVEFESAVNVVKKHLLNEFRVMETCLCVTVIFYVVRKKENLVTITITRLLSYLDFFNGSLNH